MTDTCPSRLRWRILAAAVRHSANAASDGDTARASVRSFATFGLVPQQPRGEDTAAFDVGSGLSLVLRYRQPTTVEDMIGFNNTGNVCVWPAEEVLAAYAVRHPELFRGKSVCELGGGMASVGGMAIAALCGPSRVLITDGNPQSVADIRPPVSAHNVRANAAAVPAAEAGRLVWSEDGADEPREWAGAFDVVVAADCLFFTEAHSALLATAARLLRPGGCFLSIAPRRGKTFGLFVAAAAAHPCFGPAAVSTVTEEWDASVATSVDAARSGAPANGFVADLHEPVALELTRTA